MGDLYSILDVFVGGCVASNESLFFGSFVNIQYPTIYPVCNNGMCSMQAAYLLAEDLLLWLDLRLTDYI